MDAEWMVSGFRRVLRGVCDCEFLLDHELKIRGALAIFTTEVYSFRLGGVGWKKGCNIALNQTRIQYSWEVDFCFASFIPS